MTEKQQIRKEIAIRRQALDPTWLEERSRRVVEHLLRLTAFHSARTVALSKAIDGEVQLDALFATCWSLGKRVCIPVYSKPMKAYALSQIHPETRYITGLYGIQEPASAMRTDLDEVDLMVVPGVAFDSKGNRLGRGGGYYDRLLQAYKGPVVAVAFDFQIVEFIPVESHDKPVQTLVTETTTIQV